MQPASLAFENAFEATLAGIKNTFRRGPAFGRLTPEMRFEGGVALVTGASSGLGFALAVELARRGMQVWGAARTATDEVTQKLRQATGSDRIEMLPVDLGDLESIAALVADIEARDLKFDLVICNAAIVPTHDQRTPQGLEQMEVVNFISTQVLLHALHQRGRLAKHRARLPRIVIVSSEAHRGATELDPAQIGEYRPFGVGDVIGLYGTYKLALTTLTVELSRRLEGEVSVHSLCPGAVDTNLAREAPRWSKPLIKLAFWLFFQDPAKAAEPVIYLGLAPQIEGETGIYLHQWVRKEPDPRAMDGERGRAQWETVEKVLIRR
ncbi:MAG: SDR family NAD(P)-dependent oxidoreductase [Myxococcales bacterium]|nr:SDR family NAD(P)-dependent oxidoreductase [Myxococcales bacterium]